MSSGVAGLSRVMQVAPATTKRTLFTPVTSTMMVMVLVETAQRFVKDP